EDVRPPSHSVVLDTETKRLVREAHVWRALGPVDLRGPPVTVVRRQIQALSVALSYDRHKVRPESTTSTLGPNVLQRNGRTAGKARRAISSDCPPPSHIRPS